MTRVVHDCDPGNDDALGILVAAGHPGLSLAAVTTGAGHLAADRTARNAAVMVATLAGPLPPVTAGAAGPLVRERLVAQVLDMSAGLDPERPDLPAVDLSPLSSPELLRRVAADEPGVVVAATGPLTNLALALRTDPGFARRVGRIVFLGGSWGLGNKTAAAEWNVLCDPEAASAVFRSGIPITVIPIDAASTITIDDALVDGAASSPIAVELLRSLRATHRPGPFGPADAPLNDPLALLVAGEPGLARTLPARVDVELAGRHTYGRTVIDFAGRSGPVNCDVVVGFDVPATCRAFLGAIAKR